MTSSSSATAVLADLIAAGIEVSTDGGDLTLIADAAVLSPELSARVRDAKQEILRLLVSGAITEKVPDLAVPHVPHVSHADTLSTPSRAENSPIGATCGTRGTVDDDAPCAEERTVHATPITVDFETRAPVSLELVGARTYAANPEMEVLCAAIIMPEGTVYDWVPGKPLPPALVELVTAGYPVMAHNAYGFDRFVWRMLGWPEPKWIDTLHLARVGGMPAALADFAAAELGMTKDAEGRAIMLTVGRLDRQGRLPAISLAQHRAIRKYCRQDATILRKGWKRCLARAHAIEPQVRIVDTVINDRGFRFDSDLAYGILSVERRLALEARERAGVDEKLLASTKQFKVALAEGGVFVEDAKQQTLLDLLDDPDVPRDAHAVISARIAASGIARHKLRNALRQVGDDGRLRDTLVYCQAHTGRWAGRSFQPQNLPRGALVDDEAVLDRAVDAVLREDVAAVREIAEALTVSPREVCATLVRACIIAPPGSVLGTVDYAQIEARALLWLAGDHAALQKFADGIDPYVDMAARLFSIELAAVTKMQRSIGKPLVLGAGYGMGPARFEAYASTFNVDWNAAGITPARAIEGWRAAHPAVAGYPTTFGDGLVFRKDGLWQKLESAAERAARGGRGRIGPLAWERRGRHVVCVLPGGRPLIYREARLELHPTPWGKHRWTFTYEHRGRRVFTYGAKLAENVTQAICRDILADALVRLNAAGKRVVLHVHDEVVAELCARSELREMEQLMEQPPHWAPGLPLKVSGFTSTRYRK